MNEQQPELNPWGISKPPIEPAPDDSSNASSALEALTCLHCSMYVFPRADGKCSICNEEADSKIPTRKRMAIRSDVRNAVWLAAFIAFLPAGLSAILRLSNGSNRWDYRTVCVFALSLGLGFIFTFSGILCGYGKNLGRRLAFLFSIPLLAMFPIGTVVALYLLRKLTRAEVVAEFE